MVSDQMSTGINQLIQLARDLREHRHVETAVVRGLGLSDVTESPVLAVEPVEGSQAVPPGFVTADLRFFGWRRGRIRFRPA